MTYEWPACRPSNTRPPLPLGRSQVALLFYCMGQNRIIVRLDLRPASGPSSHPNVLAIPPSHGRYRYAGMFCINSGVGVAADVFASSVINIYSNTHCSVFVSLVTAIMYVQVFSDVCLVCSQVRVAPGMLSPVLIGRFVFFFCV